MLARVTMWEGGDAEGLRAAAAEMRSNAAEGPPPGMKSTGITMLIDPDKGRAMMIGLFETPEDLADSEAILAGMTPPEGIGHRTSLDIYEVGMEARL